VASILKVSKLQIEMILIVMMVPIQYCNLQYWIGRKWSEGCFSSGIKAIVEVGEKFLFKVKTAEEDEVLVENETTEDASTPALRTPASASQKYFGKFFSKEIIDKEDLTLEYFKLKLQKDVDDFKSHINANNFKIFHQIKSTATFWIKNVIKFPLLSKLALVLLNIKSSSSSIKRYFSICGFGSKKNRGNICDDLYKTRCMLRANIEILKRMNKISY